VVEGTQRAHQIFHVMDRFDDKTKLTNKVKIYESIALCFDLVGWGRCRSTRGRCSEKSSEDIFMIFLFLNFIKYFLFCRRFFGLSKAFYKRMN
jgi:hypothetical protein